MRYMPLLKTLFLLFVLLSLPLARSHAAGRGSTTRRSGVVQAVDQAKHAFTLLPDGETKPVVIEWRNESGFFAGQKTEFFADQAPASEIILKKGIRVQVRYREALFVPNAATLVRWLKPLPVTHP